VVETMMDLGETRAAIRGIQAVSDLPVICTMTFERGGRTIMGATPAEVAAELAALGVAALGANCSTGPAEMLPVIEAMAEASSLPIIAKPNAGLPELVEGRTVFPEGPAAFAAGAIRLVEAGARLVGGCCGTTPEHIEALRGLLARSETRTRT
jgi:5-methyltetrahydrofolate--homocysteine methyltransferase